MTDTRLTELEDELIWAAVNWRSDLIPKTGMAGWRAVNRLTEAVDAYLDHIRGSDD